MGRPLRKLPPNDYVFICQTAVGGMEIFRDRHDMDKLIEAIDRNKKRHGFEMVGFDILPSEVYLVINPNGCDMVTALQGVFTSAAKRYCARYGWKGHVFRSRYKDLKIGRGRRLKRVLDTIEQEPVRLGLVKDARDWRYSSYSHRKGLMPDSLVDEIGPAKRSPGTRPMDEVKIFDWMKYASKRDLLDVLAEGRSRAPNDLWLSLRYGPDAFIRRVKTRRSRI